MKRNHSRLLGVGRRVPPPYPLSADHMHQWERMQGETMGILQAYRNAAPPLVLILSPVCIAASLAPDSSYHLHATNSSCDLCCTQSVLTIHYQYARVKQGEMMLDPRRFEAKEKPMREERIRRHSRSSRRSERGGTWGAGVHDIKKIWEE
jgi:hypothetical protein